MDVVKSKVWDVIVIGGGPSGSTVARKLALAKKNVLLLDASIFPRVKLCAGWVTKQALFDLELNPDEYPLTIQPFSSIFNGTTIFTLLIVIEIYIFKNCTFFLISISFPLSSFPNTLTT